MRLEYIQLAFHTDELQYIGRHYMYGYLNSVVSFRTPFVISEGDARLDMKCYEYSNVSFAIVTRKLGVNTSRHSNKNMYGNYTYLGLYSKVYLSIIRHRLIITPRNA